jgi:N-acetylmuramoyl-L-alanine amidase
MLFIMLRWSSMLRAAALSIAIAAIPFAATPVCAQQDQSQQPAQVAPPPQAPPATPLQQPAPNQTPAVSQPPARLSPVIVINASHGGTDNGARGPNGPVEKDVVLIFARMARSEFERQGYRVVMTRNDDSNPSYEDRAAVANAYRDAIFISFHVSSTGQIGTARAYSYPVSAPIAAANQTEVPVGPTGRPISLIPWETGQQSYVQASHRLADALQSTLALRFNGSPKVSAQFAVRELRSVAAPAIAVEVSSVSTEDPNSLLVMGAPLAFSIVRTVVALRPPGSSPNASLGPTGGK